MQTVFLLVRAVLIALVVAVLPYPKTSTVYALEGADYHKTRREMETLINGGDYEKAYEIVGELIKINPLDSEQLWTRGWLAERLELWSEAGDAFASALHMGTVYEAPTARRTAFAYAKALRKDDALFWLEKAVELGLDRRYELPDKDEFADWVDDPDFARLTGLATKKIKSRKKRWATDIDFLVEEAQRLHANPKRLAFEPLFLDEAKRLKRSIGEKSDTQMMMGIQKLIVLLGDGHTYVRAGFVHEKGLQPASVERRTLPVVFHPFGNDIYIINGEQDGADLIGGKVISLDGMPVRDFIDRAHVYLHKDNSESWKFLGANFSFRRLAFLQALGLAESGSVHVVAQMRDGTTKSVELSAGDHKFPRRLKPLPDQENPSLFLRGKDQLYWGTEFLKEQITYVQINSMRDARNQESLAKFVQRSVSAALDKKLPNLLIDFRLNNGGNSGLCDAVVKEALRFQFESELNRIFVLSRHGTFSAAQNCISRLEAVTEALFVGEPSSSRPNFTGEESEAMLPYSGLVVSISNRYWQNSQPWDNRPFIPMDIPAEISFEDYVQGRDPGFAAIVDFISEE